MISLCESDSKKNNCIQPNTSLSLTCCLAFSAKELALHVKLPKYPRQLLVITDGRPLRNDKMTKLSPLPFPRFPVFSYFPGGAKGKSHENGRFKSLPEKGDTGGVEPAGDGDGDAGGESLF